MGQKPRLPRSITIRKVVPIMVTVDSKSFTPSEWAEYLEDLRSGKIQSKLKDQFVGALECTDPEELMDLVLNSKIPYEFSVNCKKHPFIRI